MGNASNHNIRYPNINRASIQRARPLLFIFALVSAWILARLIITLSTTQASDMEVRLLAPNILTDNDKETAKPYLIADRDEKLVLNQTVLNNNAITSDLRVYIQNDQTAYEQEGDSDDHLYGGGINTQSTISSIVYGCCRGAQRCNSI